MPHSLAVSSRQEAAKRTEKEGERERERVARSKVFGELSAGARDKNVNWSICGPSPPPGEKLLGSAGFPLPPGP